MEECDLEIVSHEGHGHDRDLVFDGVVFRMWCDPSAAVNKLREAYEALGHLAYSDEYFRSESDARPNKLQQVAQLGWSAALSVFGNRAGVDAFRDQVQKFVARGGGLVGCSARSIGGAPWAILYLEDPANGARVEAFAGFDLVFYEPLGTGAGSMRLPNSTGLLSGRAGNVAYLHDVGVGALHGPEHSELELALGGHLTPLNDAGVHGANDQEKLDWLQRWVNNQYSAFVLSCHSKDPGGAGKAYQVRVTNEFWVHLSRIFDATTLSATEFLFLNACDSIWPTTQSDGGGISTFLEKTLKGRRLAALGINGKLITDVAAQVGVEVIRRLFGSGATELGAALRDTRRQMLLDPANGNPAVLAYTLVGNPYWQASLLRQLPQTRAA